MSIFALSDLHLGTAQGKSMDRFGPLWVDHLHKLQTAWRAVVAAEDTVLVPGDISWALRLADFTPDLDIIAALPGRKIISRGNHDYYWQSKAKMKQLLPDNIIALDQSVACCEGYAIAGIKGWLTPGAVVYDAAEDEKFYLRERGRLETTLQEASRLDLPILVQMHFPPYAHPEDLGFTDILERYQVQICVYGHLHSGSWEKQTGGVLRGVRYQLVSADYLNFQPIEIAIND